MTLKHLFRNGGKATLISVVVNSALYLIGSSLDFISDSVLLDGINVKEPLSLFYVVAATFTACIFATLIFALIDKFTEHAAPWFLAIALIGLIASFFTPFTIEGAPISMIVILELMHAFTAMILLYLLIPKK